MKNPFARWTVWIPLLAASCLGSLPSFPWAAQQPDDAPVQDAGGKIVVSVNKVLVPVVVRDGQGRAVGGLTKENFQILDEGKPRAISGFSIEERQIPRDAGNGAATGAPASGAAATAKEKGRAWLARDSGEVLNIQTALMEEIPAAHVRHWYVSVGYAPVRFRARDASLWLPQTVNAYCEFEDHRTIVYHTFTNFVLSSVETDQTIEKPKQP